MLRNVLLSLGIRNRRRSIFVLLLTYISFFLCINAITNSYASKMQIETVKNMFASDMNDIYRISCVYLKDEMEFGSQLFDIKNKIKNEYHLVYGAYEVTNTGFHELTDNQRFIELNRKFYEGSFMEEHPEGVQVVFCDPEIMEMIDIGLSSNELRSAGQDDSNCLPIYVGEDFKQILEIGQVLTMYRTGAKYIVAGYLENKRWFDNEFDNIAWPTKSMKHSFLAPFCEVDQTDSMTQLSTLSNIFITGKVTDDIIHNILADAMNTNVKLEVLKVSDLVKLQSEINQDANVILYQIAFTVILCSAVSIISLISALMYLNKREYGIRIAFGSTKKMIIFESILEYGILILISIFFSYLSAKKSILEMTAETYKNMKLMTLNQISVWVVLGVGLLLTIILILPQIVFLKQYNPCELMREDA